MNEQQLCEIIRPMPRSVYEVDIAVNYLPNQLEYWTEDGTQYDLTPDFQRGRVWSLEQKKAYLENLIRRRAPNTLMFNCPHYHRSMGQDTDMEPDVVVCVDGLQRITATLEFLDDQFKIFDDQLTKDDLSKTQFSLRAIRFKIQIYEFCYRKELLRFYIDLNSGGVVHSKEEIDRVKQLLEQEK